jgi:hypothetical protein
MFLPDMHNDQPEKHPKPGPMTGFLISIVSKAVQIESFCALMYEKARFV